MTFITVIQRFLSDRYKKSLLIVKRKGNYIGVAIKEYLEREKVKVQYVENLQQFSVEKQHESTEINQNLVIIFDNSELENPYIKYAFELEHAKVIIVCDKDLLHPTLDPSLYFAPLKNGRIQKQFLSIFYRDDSEYVFKSLAVKKISPARSSTEKSIDRSNNYYCRYLSSRLMAMDAALMQLLADRVNSDVTFRGFLFKLIYASRDDKGMQVAATNAITILNYAKVSFSGMDLSGIKISNADLSGGNFDSANFSGSVLSGVIFKNAYIANVIFSDCTMDNVDFGEYRKLPKDPKQGYESDVTRYGDTFISAVVYKSENNDRVRVFDFISNRTLLEVSVGYIDVLWIHFDENGMYMWVEGNNKKNSKEITILFRISDGKKLKVWQEDIKYLDFSPQKNIIVLRGKDSQVLIEAVSNSKLRKFINTKRNGIAGIGRFKNICFDDQGNYLAISNYDGVRIFDTDNFKIYCHLIPVVDTPFIDQVVMNSANDEADNFYDMCAVCFKPNGKILVTGWGDELQVWDYYNRRYMASLIGHTAFIYALAFSKDGAMLVSGSDDNTIRLWDAVGWRELRVIANLSDRITKLLFHGTKPWVAYSSQGEISFVNIHTKTPQLSQGHEHVVSSVTINPQFTRVATCSWDHTIRLWQTNNCMLLKIISYNFKSCPKKVFFSLDGKKIFVVIDHVMAFLGHVNESREFVPLYCYDLDAQVMTEILVTSGKIVVSPDRNILAILDDEEMTIWDIVKNKIINKWIENYEDIVDENNKRRCNSITEFIFTSSGKHLILGYESGEVCFVDITTLERRLLSKPRLQFPPTKSEIVLLMIDQYNRLFIVNEQGDIAIPGRESKTIHTNLKSIYKICVLSRNIVIIADGMFLIIFDLQANSILYQKHAHISGVNDMVFSEKNILVTVSADYAISYWRIMEQYGKYSILLISTSRPLFNAYKCDITNVKKLDQLSSQLLLQFGAFSSDKRNAKNVSKESSALIDVKPYSLGV